jgi:hypothetical protein
MKREGFALVFVIMIAAAIELLSLSTLALATHESALVAARERSAVAERTADRALRGFARTWPDPAIADLLPVGRTVTRSAGNGVAVEITRHSYGVYEAVAHVPAGPVTIHRRMVLRLLDLQRAMAEANDAVITAGFLSAADANLSVSSVTGCAPPAAVSRLPRPLTVSAPRFAAGHPEVTVDSAHAVSPAGYAFAGARWSEVAGLADVIAGGSWTLLPADTAGQAVARLIYGRGDLTVAGNGAGMLLVDGDLRMTAGTVFHGAIVVRGTVEIEDDVEIDGSLRIQGRGASHIGSARISHSACAVSAAFLGAPAARKIIARGRRFLPAF